MLLFKKKYLPAIRAGEKTQTVRLWKHRRMRAGQRSYIPGAGYIHVDDVDVVAIDELTDDDARRDGFDSAEILRREIEQLYADELAAGYAAYRVTFHTVDRCPADGTCAAALESEVRATDAPSETDPDRGATLPPPP